jgi:hypothetical protein
MDELKIHVLMQARDRIFDASGNLPFTIDFGLCRRTPDDTDPRSLLIDIAGSALDVPYALANKLLVSQGIRTPPLDKKRLKHLKLNAPVEEGKRYITLPSPVGRTKHYKDSFTMLEYRVDKDSEVASLFRCGKEFRIALASSDLGIKWYTYIDDPSLPIDQDILSRPSGTAKIVNLKPSAGHLAFKVVDSLPWPPEVSTRLKFIAASDTTPDSLLQISITNMSSRPLSLEPHARPQLYLGHRDIIGDRTTTRPRFHRALEADLPLSLFSFSITDTVSKEEVADFLPRPGCEGVTRGNLDPRPRGKGLFILKPGEAVLRHFDPSALLRKCGDGVYSIRLREKAQWWCVGSAEEICHKEDGDGDEGRVRKDFFSRDIPPLVLRSEDTIEVRKVDGEIVGT